MIKKGPLRLRPVLPWRYWLMFVLGVGLIFIVGVHVANGDDLEEAGRSVTTPTGEDDASNMKIIDKEQFIDGDTFDQKDSPVWPLIVELRRAAQNDYNNGHGFQMKK